MSRPTYGQAQVLQNAIQGRGLHEGFGASTSKSALNRAFDQRNADIRACEAARWLDDRRCITLTGEAALARYQNGERNG